MVESVIGYRSGPFASVGMGLPGDHEGKTATRVIFVQGSDKLALIDSGIHAGLPALSQAFRELGKNPADLDYLLLTHEHMDHVGNNGWLKQETGCVVLGHAARAERVADNLLNATTIVHAFPEGKSFDLKSEYLDWMGPVEGPIDKTIVEGDVVDLGGGVELEVLEVLGHSMAEIGFFERQSASLVIADPLLPTVNPVLYLYEDPNIMRETFDKIERFLDERRVSTILFAHDEPKGVDETVELLNDCRRRVDKVEESILRHIGSNPGIGFAELRDKCCDDQEKVREWRALVSINASLRDFESKGLVREENGGWRLAN
ncbi:MAG: MBL fold metallo-hydrolase [Albidovulum sp.]|nr:MBL fold metallo-hydrolase [Albidovulum sp.]MDE0534287.1 MBL fold metallo-hydrolase [Albidovulum sp.]